MSEEVCNSVLDPDSPNVVCENPKEINGSEDSAIFGIFKDPAQYQPKLRKTPKRKASETESIENSENSNGDNVHRSRTPSGQILTSSIETIKSQLRAQVSGSSQPFKLVRRECVKGHALGAVSTSSPNRAVNAKWSANRNHSTGRKKTNTDANHAKYVNIHTCIKFGEPIK